MARPTTAQLDAYYDSIIADEDVAEAAYWDSVAQAEMAAENAWLVAAEAPTLDDLAFEAWEMSQGLS